MAFGKFVDRRAHERAKVLIQGRLMLADRREYACTITDVSTGGFAVQARERGNIGEPVVVYVPDVGRLQGEIVRHFPGGFGVKFTAASRAAELLTKRYAA